MRVTQSEGLNGAYSFPTERLQLILKKNEGSSHLCVIIEGSEAVRKLHDNHGGLSPRLQPLPFFAPSFFDRLDHMAEQVTRMLKRITTKTRGVGESDTFRLVQAFVISRITYAIPYALLSTTELKKLDTIIRKAYKQAVRLPVSTSTNKLLRVGVNNTADELIEAHLSHQRASLGTTKTGRSCLSRFGLSIPLQHPTSQVTDIPHDIRRHIKVPALPLNMHPVHNADRREARARAILKQYGSHPAVAYADAALYPGRRASVATVIIGQEHRTSVSLDRANPLLAKEAATALALTQTQVDTVITVSQHAGRGFYCGRIHKTAPKILQQKPLARPAKIIWAPAHIGVSGIEIAHLTARELTVRAPEDEDLRPLPL